MFVGLLAILYTITDFNFKIFRYSCLLTLKLHFIPHVYPIYMSLKVNRGWL
jgi:hypothetical protein